MLQLGLQGTGVFKFVPIEEKLCGCPSVYLDSTSSVVPKSVKTILDFAQ